MINKLIAVLVCFAAVQSALADGDAVCQPGADCDQVAPPPQPSTETSVPQLDPRLPPVLPGEEVVVNGKRMKVWSTSGPVPVGNPPEPWREFNGRTYVDSPNIDVIVDGRNEWKREEKPRGPK